MLPKEHGRAQMVQPLPTVASHSTQDLLERIISEHSAFSHALASLSDGLAKLEKRLEETDHQMEALEAKVVSTQRCVLKHSTLMKELAIGRRVADQRLENLENKMRARNLRVTGVPAAVEDGNLVPYLENLVSTAAGFKNKEGPISIESAYRLPPGNAQEGHGGTVIITLSNLQQRERILKASRASWTAMFHGHKVSFFPDLSPATYTRRKHFLALKQQFLEEGAHAYLLFPAKLKVVHKGKSYIFKDSRSAAQLLDKIRQGSWWKGKSNKDLS